MTAPATLEPELLIEGRYTLRAPLDDWGVGEAWTAADARFRDRVVVVKFFPEGDPALTEVLLARLETARGLRHPRVLPLIDHGAHAGRAFAVYEHGPLRSLGSWLDEAREGGRLPPLERVRDLFAQLCEAIATAHGESVPLFHEGLSPNAVMLREGADELRTRVFDFGVVPFADPIAASPESARSVSCVAPEQFQGEPADPSTDQFALALLLLELLAAPRPDASTGAYKGRRDVPDAVWQAARRALQTTRAQRFESVEAFATALATAWSEPVTPVADVVPVPEAPPAPAPAPALAPAPAPAKPTVTLYDDDAVAARRGLAATLPIEVVSSVPAVFVPGAQDTAPISEAMIAALDDPPEIGERTIALPHSPAAIVATAPPGDLEDNPIGERTIALSQGPIDDVDLASTVALDAAAIFHDAVPDGLSTMRANRDPRALMEMTRRYREVISRPPPRPAVAAPTPAVAAPAVAVTLPRPEALAPQEVSRAPAPTQDAPASNTRRVAVAALSMLLAFAAVLGIVLAIFRARHR